MGRCLALAALGEGPTSVDEAVVAVPDLEYLRVGGRLQSQQTCSYVDLFRICRPLPKHEAEAPPTPLPKNETVSHLDNPQTKQVKQQTCVQT